MPKYTPSDDELDESYSAPVTPPEGGAESPPGQSVDEENESSSEILVSKQELPAGTKEGDTCTFRVVKDYGDEFSLEYAKAGAGESPTESSTAAEDFAAMDQSES